MSTSATFWSCITRPRRADDSDFWNYCRTLDPPEGLAYKLAMFRSSGRIFREHNELFTETSWLAVMAGQGIVAEGYHPAADLLPDEETLNRLSHIREVIATTAKLMPTQDEFLRQTGGRNATPFCAAHPDEPASTEVHSRIWERRPCIARQ